MASHQREDHIGNRPVPEASLSAERAQHNLPTERALHPGTAWVNPLEPTSSAGSSAESRMAGSANLGITQAGPLAQRLPSPYIYKFLQDVFPPLSAPDVVRRFADAGIAECKDLITCSRLPERGGGRRSTQAERRASSRDVLYLF